MSVPTIIEFVTSPTWLGLTLSPAQETLLRAIYGLPLSPEQRALWQRCTGRARYPEAPVDEVTVIAGARSGKDSRILVPVLVYEATMSGAEHHLGAGEIGVIPLVAPTERSTRIAFGYVRDAFERCALLKELVEDVRESEIWLRNRMRISCFACTGRGLRGYSFPAAGLDELAFFRLEATTSDADVEIQTAIKRGGVGFPHQKLIKISTPYAKGGLLWDDYARYYGKDDADVLVWQAPTTLMNPTVAESRLASERRRDAARASREYDALFHDDVAAFLPAAWIDEATVDGRHRLPPREGVRYLAAVDPSGGSADAFALAIVHVAAGRFVQDVMKGWAGSRTENADLTGVCMEIAAIVREYGAYVVHGDHYAGQWVAQEFRKAGLRYEPFDADKSTAYRELEPRLAQGAVELLDHPVMLRELRLLERRTRLGGKPATIDHPKGAHDDHANALAVAVAQLAKTLHPAVGMTGAQARAAAARDTGGAEASVPASSRDRLHGGERFWPAGERRRGLGMFR